MTDHDPMALLGGLVLEDGRRWGQTAAPFQLADARALLDRDPGAPRMHFITRPRGGSKTTDLAAVMLSAMLTQAPERSTSHAYAVDRGQAALLTSALVGFAQRSGLMGLLNVTTWSVTVKATEARLVVESADAPSAFGHRPFIVSLDEFCQWPSGKASRELWEAVASGLPKRPDSRLAIITTSGDPAHWSAEVIRGARASDRWRVSETPGPLPWTDPEDLAEQRRLLPAASFARLHLNQWVAADDRLVDPTDLAACVTLPGPLEPDPRHRYVVGLDIGLKGDRTVVAVCHAEPPEHDPNGPPVVVLDRMHVLEGTRERPVQLSDVEAVVQQAASSYRAAVRCDPWQSIGLAQRLRARGIEVTEWPFTSQSTGRLASTMHLLLREHRLALPDDPQLLAELGNVRLRETSTPGVFRIDHDRGHHDDRAVALGLAALALTERAPTGAGRLTVPTGSIRRDATATSARSGSRLDLGPRTAEIRQASRSAIHVPGAASPLLVRGSANDPLHARRRWW